MVKGEGCITINIIYNLFGIQCFDHSDHYKKIFLSGRSLSSFVCVCLLRPFVSGVQD